LWLHSLKVAQLLRSAACLHTNQSRSYLNHLVFNEAGKSRSDPSYHRLKIQEQTKNVLIRSLKMRDEILHSAMFRLGSI